MPNIASQSTKNILRKLSLAKKPSYAYQVRLSKEQPVEAMEYRVLRNLRKVLSADRFEQISQEVAKMDVYDKLGFLFHTQELIKKQWKSREK
jgi:hypothetical protein|tara:strand:- start:218 stop:493 length:276 start_codon:yes stop_codon:yes gene_type:complete